MATNVYLTAYWRGQASQARQRQACFHSGDHCEAFLLLGINTCGIKQP